MPLHVFTSRVNTKDPDRFVVVRSGAAKDPAGFPFAPSAPLLKRALGRRAHEGGEFATATWEWYVEAYTAEMRESYRTNRAAWQELLSRPRVVVCCYCPTDKTSPSETRCHRTILAEILVKLGAVDGGEIS